MWRAVWLNRSLNKYSLTTQPLPGSFHHNNNHESPKDTRISKIQLCLPPFLGFLLGLFASFFRSLDLIGVSWITGRLVRTTLVKSWSCDPWRRQIQLRLPSFQSCLLGLSAFFLHLVDLFGTLSDYRSNIKWRTNIISNSVPSRVTADSSLADNTTRNPLPIKQSWTILVVPYQRLDVSQSPSKQQDGGACLHK